MYKSNFSDFKFFLFTVSFPFSSLLTFFNIFLQTFDNPTLCKCPPILFMGWKKHLYRLKQPHRVWCERLIVHLLKQELVKKQRNTPTGSI